jgi:thioredoxin-dependent peroxiredoxin
MARITLKSNPIQTFGELPKVGEIAPSFALTGSDLNEATLDQYTGKLKLLNIFPSIDTPTCAMSVRKFHEKLAQDKGLVILNISADLPFAQARFCAAEGIKNAVSLSTFRSSFGRDYGVEIVDGPIRGLLSRAVILLDADNRVVYTEQVPEIAQEPSYEKLLNQVYALR